MDEHPGREVPIFSVVIPTHNRQDLLTEAINSVLKQSLPEWELIVVDDGGSVPTKVPQDPRIRLVRHGQSLGPAAARNTGIWHARGRFLAFLDDDDAWAPTRLANALRGHEIAPIVVCGESVMGAGRRDYPDQGSVEVLPQPHEWVMDRTAPHTGRVSVRRTDCVDFNPAYRAAEDLDWWLRVTMGQKELAMVGTPDWRWRRHDGPRGDIGVLRRIEGSRRLLEEHSDYFRGHRRARAFRHRRLGQMLLTVGEFREALRAGIESTKSLPSAGGLWLLIKTLGKWGVTFVLCRR